MATMVLRRYRPTTLCWLLSMLAIGAGGPAIACAPLRPGGTPPMRDADRTAAARRMVKESAVIADGVIIWSKAGWAAMSKPDVGAEISFIDTFPRLRPTRVYKGVRRPQYLLDDQHGGCGPSTLVRGLAPGTKVRLLLTPLVARSLPTVWVVTDTSYTGRRRDEAAINAKIDVLIGAKRPAGTVSPLIDLELPPPLPDNGHRRKTPAR
jgi:hypothetical protein